MVFDVDGFGVEGVVVIDVVYVDVGVGFEGGFVFVLGVGGVWDV